MITLDRTTTDTLADPHAMASASGLALISLHDGLWRVTRPDGEVLGYVERLTAKDGGRFRAKRISVRLRQFVNVGEFWQMRDAVECFANG
jgi:predicted methyltransferase